jgi:hypothetical protein
MTVSSEIQSILLLVVPVAVAVSIIAVVISRRSAQNMGLAVVLLTFAFFHFFITATFVPTPFGNAACRFPTIGGPGLYEFILSCDGPIWWIAPIVLGLVVAIWVLRRGEG